MSIERPTNEDWEFVAQRAQEHADKRRAQGPSKLRRARNAAKKTAAVVGGAGVVAGVVDLVADSPSGESINQSLTGLEQRLEQDGTHRAEQYQTGELDPTKPGVLQARVNKDGEVELHPVPDSDVG